MFGDITALIILLSLLIRISANVSRERERQDDVQILRRKLSHVAAEIVSLNRSLAQLTREPIISENPSLTGMLHLVDRMYEAINESRSARSGSEENERNFSNLHAHQSILPSSLLKNGLHHFAHEHTICMAVRAHRYSSNAEFVRFNMKSILANEASSSPQLSVFFSAGCKQFSKQVQN